MSSEDKCKIKKTILADGLLSPLLINFDNRPLTKEETNCSVCTWRDGDSGNAERLIHLETDENATYQGSLNNKKISKTILVLQNKTSNKVQLVEVNECNLSRVLPMPHLQTNYENDKMETTYEENRLNLMKAFGSKKGKHAVLGSKLKINSEITMTQMKHTAAGVNVELKDLEAVDSLVDTCMPTCHRDAKHPSEVFLIEDFLTEQEIYSLEDEAFTVFHLMPFTEEESGYSQFFIDTLDQLQNKAKEDRISIMLYVEALMKFLKLDKIQTMKQKEIIEKTCPYSYIIGKKILDHFSEDTTNGRIRNTTMNDKIVVHIMILLLIVCDSSCNVEKLSNHLPRFSVTKLGHIARALCLSTKDKITWFIKIPLPPLKTKFIRKKKN